jgi:opacity protein-like surface antigen
MHARLALVVAVSASLTVSQGADAQSAQPWSLQASVLAAGQDINSGLVTGVGFEGQLRYSRGVWSLGVGYQTSKHTAADEFIKISGFFLEPRYAIDIGSERVAPYVAGRVAFLKQNSELHDPDNPTSELFTTESNGSAFGAGGGLIIRATSKINIDLGAAFVSQSFAEVRGEGRVFQFSRFTGYVAKGGLSFGFGG